VTFDAAVLELLAAVEEVEIETRPDPAAPSHRVIIWVVVDGGEVFVRSVRGTRGRWYREIRSNPLGALHADGAVIPVRAMPATDAASIERCSRALARKYAGDPSLGYMLVPEVLETTIRLEPA
jgi:hypothetical protein